MRRCGLHGDDTTSGRCATCDRILAAHTFNPDGCEGPLGSYSPGVARCSCGWASGYLSSTRMDAQEAWREMHKRYLLRPEGMAAAIADADRRAGNAG